MSEPRSPTLGKLRGERPLLDAALAELRGQLAGPRSDVAIRFAELFLERAPARAVEGRTGSHLAWMARTAFEFLERSRPDRVDVEVMNPDEEWVGGDVAVTVVRTNVSERPFVVDTLREFLHSEGLSIELYVYPVLQVDRDEKGRVVGVAPAASGRTRESLIHCEIARVTDPDRRETLRGEISGRLEQVVAVTNDFGGMVDALNETVTLLAQTAHTAPGAAEEVAEAQAFLRWLRDGAFVFLGYRGYRAEEREGARHLEVEPGSGLGILRDGGESSVAAPVPLDELPERFQAVLDDAPLLLISKTNAVSPVHRRTRMDYIGVRRLDAEGRLIGERRFLGLFTTRAYAEDAEQIPILRRKLGQILDQAGVHAGSHDYKEIHTIVNSLPKEELFLTSVEEIASDVRTVLTSYGYDEVRVALRRDPLGRGVSIMVIFAKDRFSGEVRKQIETAFVERLGGEVLNYHLALGEGDQARLHFFLAAPPEEVEAIPVAELEETVRRLTRSWEDRVREGLVELGLSEEARRLSRSYAEGFGPEYQAATPPEVAVRDILELEGMSEGGRLVAIAFRNPESDPSITELKVYLREARLVLSDFMPILEGCGLRVISVTPFEVRGEGVCEGVLHSFTVQDGAHAPLDIAEVGPRLAETILAIRAGSATNDVLNGLVLTAGLAWREVEVLRTYASYAFQLGVVPSRLAAPSALLAYPAIAALLFRSFHVRFDPAGPERMQDRLREVARLRDEFDRARRDVDLLSEDRALRRLHEVIDATVRTNYFQGGARAPSRTSGGAPYLSLKFDCSRYEGPARTRVQFEVWVRSSRMEGVHLRGGRVARGGIRHSDRPDDFRTEILGLVRTQMVKNAVIVPAGAKGGFVTLRRLAGVEMAEETREQYRTFIRGLLDLTDNLLDGTPAPPEGVVCFDEPDPYLVVAADKGTATFSDLANEVAAEYDFWLGDAFASGGSNGYDHKEVGITARGAWECVKRHFREMGKEIQSEPFTVVGIGDMSGDVFGNGMLLSRQIRLVAAFDHRDILIDPDPDPATSYRERQRLFELGRSSWQEYDRSLLSNGGMILPRGVKEVHLSDPVRAALGIPDEEAGPIDGEELVRWILRAPVELLWSAGIGTYVKASYESQPEVGDAANNAVRVDATELRCRVVGEGGNLGFTQQARIQFALAGGRINTDAIDNSGGVNLSDREVNLKILLDEEVHAGGLARAARNQLLRELADPVARLVLEDSRSLSRALSLEELRSREGLDDLRDMMSTLERTRRLNRANEALPTWEVLAERQELGKGMSRPELAVLLAYAKLNLKEHLLEGDLPEDPEARRYLRSYFPTAALQAVSEAVSEAALSRHRLCREIVASQLTNDLVDIMGPAFVHAVSRDTGATPTQVARAWLIAARMTGKGELMDHLRRRGPDFPLPTAYRWLRGLGNVLERTTRWFLSNEDMGRTITGIVEENLEGLAHLRATLPEVVTGEDRRIYEELSEELRGYGADEAFSRSLVWLRFLDQLLEILRVRRQIGADLMDAARTYYLAAELFRIPWLRQSIVAAAGDDRWEQRSSHALIEDLTRAHQSLVASVMALAGAQGHSPSHGLNEIAQSNRGALSRYQALVQEIEAEEPRSLSALAVAVRDLMRLADQFSVSDRPC